MAFPLYGSRYISLDGAAWSPVSGVFYLERQYSTESLRDDPMEFWYHQLGSRQQWPWTSGYEFDHWEYSGIQPDWLGSATASYRRSAPRGSQERAGNLIVCACFKKKEDPPGPVVTSYKVTTAALPTQGGITTGSGTYMAGAPVTITATANTGYRFICWKLSTGETSTQKNYQFSMPSVNVTAVAFFVKCTNKILRLK